MRYLVVSALLLSTSALAQETLEKVVVRNRLYSVGGSFELGANAGFTMVNALVDHINFTADLAFNFTDQFAIEVLGGYAYSHHTGLARQISNDVMAAQVSPQCPQNSCGWPTIVNDMANLWEMKANAIAGIRWAPIYGKIGLLAEIPVHFQAFVWAGGGGGMFNRESVVYCVAASGSDCNSWRTDTRVTWIASAAFGLRFFVLNGHSLKFEARNYLWPDAYKVEIDRRVAQTGGPSGHDAPSPGITNLVLLDVGYSYVF